MPSALIICASPRQGNCDSASRLLEAELNKLGLVSRVIFLRNYKIKPCIACGLCEKKTGICSQIDDVETIFKLIFSADLCVLVSPVYFYSVPAQFKALIDRAQVYFVQKDLSSDFKMHTVLIAARKHGKNLFRTSLYSLKLFALALGSRLISNLNLGGLEQAADLENNSQAQDKIKQYVGKLSPIIKS